MKIVARYSFNKGEETISPKYPKLIKEVQSIIARIDAGKCKTEKSRERSRRGKILYNLKALNSAFNKEFVKCGWKNQRVPCEYPTQFYLPDYQPPRLSKGAFREMDFIKEKLGVEAQFGKYASMICSICAKMTIFNKRGFIQAGIEIVPIKRFADQMSTGVSYFEQFVWDLEHRGVSDIDIPVLILGIDK